jgi:hypothetical protein
VGSIEKRAHHNYDAALLLISHVLTQTKTSTALYSYPFIITNSAITRVAISKPVVCS